MLKSKYAKEQIQKRKCRTKACFRTIKDGWDFSLSIFIEKGHYLSPYDCKWCDYFHMTSQVKIGNLPQHWKDGFNKWFGLTVV